MKARKIELKKADFTTPDGQETSFAYVEGLRVVLTASGQGGLTADDVMKAVELKQDLDKANGSWLVQPQDWNWIVNKLNTVVRWNFANDAIAAFIKDVREAPEIDVAA